MSNRRFIEISSANRNRNQYPQPSDFEVPFAPPRTLNQNSTLKGSYYTSTTGPTGPTSLIYTQNMDVADTVTNGIVEYLWTSYYRNGAEPVGAFDSTTTSTIPSTQSAIYVNVNGLTSPYKNVQDYYVGYQLLDYTTGNSGIIQSYTPSMGLFTLQTPLITAPAVGGTIYIIDNSQTAGTPPSIILPGIDNCGKKILSYDQAYNGYYLIDETLSASTHTIVSSKIVSYNFLTRTATLNNPIPGSAVTDQYSIRKSLPNEFHTVVTPPASNGNLTFPYFAKVPNYDQIVLNNCIFLDSTANPNDNYYSGMYIYIYPTILASTQSNQTTPLTNIEGTCFYINSYIGNGYNACFVTQVNPPNVASPTQYYPSYTSQAASYPVPSGNPSTTVINIVSFSNDNYTPLIYNGSVVSQNETVAYEINLVNLTLPNIILVTGARVAYYPYVYVELSNVTASSASSKNVIYSNNPNSNRALFLVPITDINEPQRTPFIKLDAGSMVQTVKFKPNDCLKFSVFLPDGTLYQTITSDYYSPSGPNPFCQIDALFGIKRLTGV